MFVPYGVNLKTIFSLRHSWFPRLVPVVYFHFILCVQFTQHLKVFWGFFVPIALFRWKHNFVNDYHRSLHRSFVWGRTESKDTHHCKLRYSCIGDTFHSAFNSKDRGVAILISKKLDFTVSKTIEDKNGRFLIIAGKLFHTPVLLVNIYAPNFDNPDFTNSLCSTLHFLDTHCWILAGDLNYVMNPTLDRSSPPVFTQSSMSKSISDFMFVDPWRTRNPQTNSLFSQVHQSHSRIDYFFVDVLWCIKSHLLNTTQSLYQTMLC